MQSAESVFVQQPFHVSERPRDTLYASTNVSVLRRSVLADFLGTMAAGGRCLPRLLSGGVEHVRTG